MLPLCAAEGVGTMVWSPLARGKLARPWQAAATGRSATDGAYAGTPYTPLTADSDHAIIDAVGGIAAARGVSRAQVALAWLRRNPVVAAPLVGASNARQLDDAVASLDVDLTEDEAARLTAPYTPRYDIQGISDEAELERIRAQIPGMKV